MRQAPVTGEHGDAEGEACETEGVVDYGKDFAAAQQRYGNKLLNLPSNNPAPREMPCFRYFQSWSPNIKWAP